MANWRQHQLCYVQRTIFIVFCHLSCPKSPIEGIKYIAYFGLYPQWRIFHKLLPLMLESDGCVDAYDFPGIWSICRNPASYDKGDELDIWTSTSTRLRYKKSDRCEAVIFGKLYMQPTTCHATRSRKIEYCSKRVIYFGIGYRNCGLMCGNPMYSGTACENIEL